MSQSIQPSNLSALPTEKQTTAKEQVLEVQTVELSILESNPPQLRIGVSGTVRTGGWKDAELIPYVYVQAPPDGIYDYDFVAVRPDGPATQAITPIEANYTLKNIPDNLKGVKIHASTNSLVALLSESF
jgi:hypothetical protein